MLAGCKHVTWWGTRKTDQNQTQRSHSSMREKRRWLSTYRLSFVTFLSISSLPRKKMFKFRLKWYIMILTLAFMSFPWCILNNLLVGQSFQDYPSLQGLPVILEDPEQYLEKNLKIIVFVWFFNREHMWFKFRSTSSAKGTSRSRLNMDHRTLLTLVLTVVFFTKRGSPPPHRINTDNCELCIILEQYYMKLRPCSLILIQS